MNRAEIIEKIRLMVLNTDIIGWNNTDRPLYYKEDVPNVAFLSIFDVEKSFVDGEIVDYSIYTAPICSVIKEVYKDENNNEIEFYEHPIHEGIIDNVATRPRSNSDSGFYTYVHVYYYSSFLKGNPKSGTFIPLENMGDRDLYALWHFIDKLNNKKIIGN